MPQLDQGLTFRCGAYSALAWLYAYGYDPTGTVEWRNALALADQQQGLSFPDLHRIISGLAGACNARFAWVGNGYIRSVAALDEHLRDGRCVIAGLWLGALRPGWNYQHYEAIVRLQEDEDGGYFIRDTLSRYDGEDDQAGREELLSAIARNWAGGATVGLVFSLQAA